MAVGLVPNMIRQTKGVQMEVLGGVQVGSLAQQGLVAQATHPQQLHHKAMTVEMVFREVDQLETVEVVVVLMQMVGMEQRHLLLVMVEPD